MGFLIKLWRGEVSLGTTYWIFGALVVFMFQMLSFVPLDNPESAQTLIYIQAAYFIFIAIAIFRSSIRHNGSRLFIIFAQLSAVGLLVNAALNIFAIQLLPGGSGP